MTEWLELGVFGGNNMQVTEDAGSDVYWDPSHKAGKSIIGVSGGLWVTDWLEVTLKKTWDYGLRQRFNIGGFQMNMTFVL